APPLPCSLRSSPRSPSDPPSFPTRRSSDLTPQVAALVAASENEEHPWLAVEYIRGLTLKEFVETRGPLTGAHAATLGLLVAGARSEEHTSELQSRENLVCRLLLEKKRPRTP